MILRLFRATVKPGAEREMLRRLRDETLPELRAMDGLNAFTTGFRHDGVRAEHLALSTWTDLAAIEAQAGSLERSVVSARVDDIFSDTTVDHFELVDPDASGVVTLEGPVIGVVRALVAPNADASAIAEIRATRAEIGAAGVMALHLGRRVHGNQTELVILAVWRDRTSLRRFAANRSGSLIRPSFLEQLTEWSFETWDCLSADRLLLPAAGPAILLADDTGRYVDASPGVEALLGVPGELLLGRNVADLTAPALRHNVAAAWAAFLEVRCQSGSYALSMPDGRIVPVRFRARADVPEPGVHSSVLTRADESEELLSVEELVALAFSTPLHDPVTGAPAPTLA